MHRMHVQPRAATEPVEGPAYAILGTLHDHGPVRTGALAERLHVDASTVSRQIAGLVDGGLITREADPADGRACRLRVTPRGEDALARARQGRRRAVRALLESWTEQDQATFAALLEHFNAGLDARPDGAAVPAGRPTTPGDRHHPVTARSPFPWHSPRHDVSKGDR